MVAVVAFLVFSTAMAVALAVIVAMVAPQWRRIVRLVAGHVEPEFQPLSALASAERRIAVRRWAAVRMPSRLQPLSIRSAREAA